MYTLKIKGIVAKNKQLEFKQSIKFIFKQFPKKWDDSYIANDIIYDDIFYFDSEWESKEALEQFMSNKNYKVLIGAFKVLGIDHEVSIEGIIDT